MHTVKDSKMYFKIYLSNIYLVDEQLKTSLKLFCRGGGKHIRSFKCVPDLRECMLTNVGIVPETQLFE